MHEIKFKPCRCKARTDSASVGCSWYCRFQRWKYVYVWSPYVGDTTSFWKHSRLQASNVSHLPQALLLASTVFARCSSCHCYFDWYWWFQWRRYVYVWPAYVYELLRHFQSIHVYKQASTVSHLPQTLPLVLLLLLVVTSTDTDKRFQWWRYVYVWSAYVYVNLKASMSTSKQVLCHTFHRC